MSHVASFVAGVIIAFIISMIISAIDYSRHESFKLDWCGYKATGVVREYDKEVCRAFGKNSCGHREIVHVVERQKLIVCQKLRWE